MIIPTFRNINFVEDTFIERALPSKGKILLNVGEKVSSYTKIGYSRNSIRELLIPSNFKIERKFFNSKQVKVGELVASFQNKFLFSPFDGYLENRGTSSVVVKNPEDYWLISGVSGTITAAIPSRSVLVKTSGFELKFFATSQEMCEGVLEVLPNPSELIEIEFMDKYIKNGIGKIVYTGDYLRKEMLLKAMEVGCEGLIVSSCDRDTLNLAKENNFFVGVLSGFGRIPVREKTWRFLKAYRSKYCIVREGSSNLFISETGINYKNDSPYNNLRVGLDVIVLDYPYFGWEGKVEAIERENVRVKIVKIGEEVVTHYQNLIS